MLLLCHQFQSALHKGFEWFHSLPIQRFAPAIRVRFMRRNDELNRKYPSSGVENPLPMSEPRALGDRHSTSLGTGVGDLEVTRPDLVSMFIPTQRHKPETPTKNPIATGPDL